MYVLLRFTYTWQRLSISVLAEPGVDALCWTCCKDLLFSQAWTRQPVARSAKRLELLVYTSNMHSVCTHQSCVLHHCSTDQSKHHKSIRVRWCHVCRSSWALFLHSQQCCYFRSILRLEPNRLQKNHMTSIPMQYNPCNHQAQCIANVSFTSWL